MSLPRYLSSVVAFFVLFSLVAAVPVDAAAKKVVKRSSRIGYDLYNPRKKYGDEKKVIANPESRCNTASNKRAHDANLVQAKKDVVAFHPDSDPRIEKLYKEYLTKLNIAWGAMEEPYCGFGAFGNSAAKKSYDKTVARTRDLFLTEARQTQVALKK